ncbi:hypothetical protein DSO57_1038936 [Entomophthora muscae]|uniref:Uncharacterized protein n=1 Tax=Entomophthora muscae TaxID=34485 RepID=A0ACC2TKY2_9FUNG|nr:hypothetical protein DSO57_1038936 [Entomophthora muscae]
MNNLIFTAVLTACLGIRGYQQGSEFFGPSPEGLGHDHHYDPGQLNSSHTGSWPPLVSPHSTLSIAVYTSMDIWKVQHPCQGLSLIDEYLSNFHCFDWLLISNLLPYLLQAPLPAFSLNYEQAFASACSLLHTGTVAMHSIPGCRPGYSFNDLYSFLLDFGLPPTLIN